MVAKTNITDIFAGQKLVITVSVTTSGADKSLTSATAIDFTLDTPTQITKSLDDGITVKASPNDNECVITLTAADLTGVTTGAYAYQLFVTDGSGDRAPVAYGWIDVTAAL